MTVTLSVLTTLVLLQTPPAPLIPEAPLSDVVTLSLSADRETYYRGERIKLHVSADNVSGQPVKGSFALHPKLGLKLFYKGPGMSAAVRLTECFVDIPGFFHMPFRTLQAGGGNSRDLYLSVASLEPPGPFLLDEPGEYEFRVIWVEYPDPNMILESNVVRVAVVPTPPEERDAAAAFTPLLAYLAQVERGGCYGVASSEDRIEAVAFLGRFPQSRYAAPVKEGLWSILRCRVNSQEASQEERELFERLSQSDGDTTPPYLLVDVTPAVLWPPNHKMVGVKVKVAAQDEIDPGPEVKLVSITCDDGCDPVLDIDGAILDSDDREFELRAERRGHGSGRRYTITYSATDASGNTARTSTTVLVPHDQGKGKGGK